MSYRPETFTEQYITYIFLWHSMGDACLKCLTLNGREWTNQDVFQEVLWDPIWGDIYDLTLGMPMTHGGLGNNCRCTLEVRAQINLRQINELNEFLNFMEMLNL